MKKILLIDDDAVLQKIYRDRLVNDGYDLDTTSTGQEGLTRAMQSKPDLILLDVMLPEGMNGFDVLEQLKRNPQVRNIPVIMMTNLDAEEKSVRSVGAVEYINKAATSLDLVSQKIKSILT